MKIDKQVIMDGQKNGAVMIVGELENGDSGKWHKILEASDMENPTPSHFSIGHLEFALSTGVEVVLAWHSDTNARKIIIPLSGRGRFDFSSYGGLKNTVENDRTGALEMQTWYGTDVRFFTLVFDLIKK